MALFSKMYEYKAMVAAHPKADHVCKDAQTHQIIARGTKAQMCTYQTAFGMCYVEAL